MQPSKIGIICGIVIVGIIATIALTFSIITVVEQGEEEEDAAVEVVVVGESDTETETDAETVA